MTYYLIMTAITVSIDSFVCGFSLSFNNKNKFLLISIITLTVFVMCTIVNYSTQIFATSLNEKTTCLGGILLICLGLYNLIKRKSKCDDKQNSRGVISQAIITGFAVGLDGAFANLSLSLMGMNQFFVPLTIAFTHGIMITFGILLSNTSLAKKFAKIEFLPPFILMLLGGYKLLGLFI